MKKLGEFLIEKGKLTEDKLKVALERQAISKDKLGNILIKLGFIKEKELNKLLAEQYHLEAFEDDSLLITKDTQKHFPKHLIEKYKVIPIKKLDKDFQVGISDMFALTDLDELNFALGKNVIPILIPDSMYEKIFSDLLIHQYGSKDYHFETFEKFLQNKSTDKLNINILIDAITNFDSGVHQIILSESSPIFVKKIGHFYKQSSMRIDRKLILEFIKDLTDEQIRKKLISHSSVEFKKKILNILYNITILKHKSHYSINIKKILNVVPNLENLITDKDFSDILTTPSKGIYFLTAPLSHGKSIFIASLLNYFNKEKTYNIFSIENGIKYDIASENSLITQYEVTNNSHDYHKALLLAYDIEPDILIVNNINDDKILELTLDFAESGRPVFISFESGSIPGALEKLFSLVDPNRKNYLLNKFTNLLKIIANFRMIPVEGVERKLLVYEYIKNITKIKKIIQDETYFFINSQLKGSPDFVPLEKKLATLFLNNTINHETGENNSEDIELFHKYINEK